MNLTETLQLDHVTAAGVFAATDFCLSIVATILNVIIVVTIKNSHSLGKELEYIMYACIGASNLGKFLMNT